jgi:hypothetical protein
LFYLVLIYFGDNWTVLHFAGPKPDCARLFEWLLSVVKRVGLEGDGAWVVRVTPGKVLALDLQKFR